MIAGERRLVRPHLTLRIAWRAVPGAGDDALVVTDLAVGDPHPVAERTAGCVEVAVASRFRRPGRRLPLRAFEGTDVTALDAGDEIVVPPRKLPREQHGLDAAGRR